MFASFGTRRSTVTIVTVTAVSILRIMAPPLMADVWLFQALIDWFADGTTEVIVHKTASRRTPGTRNSKGLQGLQYKSKDKMEWEEWIRIEQDRQDIIGYDTMGGDR